MNKIICYEKELSKDGSGIERLPEEAEEGRRISGSINAEATIIASGIIKAGEAAGREAQKRRSYAVEETIKCVNKVKELWREGYIILMT